MKLASLKKHIRENFDTRKAFAESIGVRAEQVRRWEIMGCLWYNGNAYRNQSNLVPNDQNSISDDYSISKEQSI